VLLASGRTTVELFRLTPWSGMKTPVGALSGIATATRILANSQRSVFSVGVIQVDGAATWR